MSYTGSCRTTFTSGQVTRADLVANFFLNDYYKEQLCGNLIDRVEIEGSGVGLNRVNIRILPTLDPSDYTQTIVNSNGDFSGKLPVSTANVTVNSDLKRFRSTDITQLDNHWLSGLTTYDLVIISKHILGIAPLGNGYKMLAADANKSNSITTFDIVLFRKLLLGIDTALAAYTQPWRFIPEVVTQNISGGTLQADFDGIDFDTPFSTVPPAMGITVAASVYCDPSWTSVMKSGTVRNGFDAVKLGNVVGVVDSLVEDCPGDVAMLVPNIELFAGDEVELIVKGFKFHSVAAFQTGIKASKEDFEFIEASSGESLTAFSVENSIGGLNYGNEGINVVWMSDNLSPKTLVDGAKLFTVTLKASKDIPDLSEAIALDKSLLETFFLTSEGGCLEEVSLEITADIHSVTGARNNGDGVLSSITQKIFCLPNPATDQLTLLFDAEQEFDGNINIHDAQGRLLEIVAHNFTIGRNVINLSGFSRFPVGILNISLYDGNQNHSVRAQKQ